MLGLILGKRDYEQTSSGKYPKYNLHQMNIYASKSCQPYTAIQIVCNVLCFDLFGKYQDEINANQKLELDDKIKSEYGLHNVNLDDLIDWERFDYIKETDTFELKEVEKIKIFKENL